MAFNWQFLTDLYRKAKVEDYFLTNMLGKQKRLSPLPEIRVRMESGSMSVAALGKIGDPPRAINASTAVTETTLQPAQIFEYDTITEDDVFTIANPEIVAVNSTAETVSNAEYIRAVKLEELKRRVMRRIELMFAEIITTGGINYNDGERAYSVSYGVTPGSLEISSSSTVYSDLLDIADEMRSAGHNPSMIIITKNVETALMGNDQIIEMLNTRTFGLGQANLKQYTNAREILRLEGLPPIVCYMGTYTNSEGSSTKYVNDSDFVIMVDSTAFRLGYGAIQNYHLSETPKAIDVASWEEVVNHGTEKALFVLSRPLPYIVSADALKIYSVTIS